MAVGVLSANFHLTHNCNLRCTYCYTGDKFGSGMSQETADQAVDFCIAEARKAEVDHLEIVFFGGEPLMKVDLLCQIADRAIEQASKCGPTEEANDSGLRVSFKMSTNGLMLSPAVIQRLAKRDVYVSISLDGDPQTQAEQRPDIRGRDTTQRLEGCIDRLLAWNPCASVNAVVTPESAGRLDESVQWLFERGFSYVQTALDYSGDWNRGDLKRLEQAYHRLAKWYVDETISGRNFYLSCFDTRIRSWAHGVPEKSERCHLGVRQFSISPRGRLYPCVQFVQEDDDDAFVIGNVVDGFDQAKRQSIVSCSETDKPECGGCALTGRCSSWCACINWQSTGELNRASPLVCEHERILMPIADGVANRLWQKRDASFMHKQYNPAFPVLAFAEHMAQQDSGLVDGEPAAEASVHREDYQSQGAAESPVVYSLKESKHVASK